ncbi:helix-turn-helix transcriptional regulator [Comamonas odontotermitis]|uniref:helix-turn-helix transcriptional regulator n=1 Tax=Comamonas odontotermitis TaxID=379895 RepID=UPI003751743F
MRARISDGQKQFQPAQADGGVDGDRAMRAAHLLQQALNLLGQGLAPPSGPASDRHDRLLRLPEVQRLTGLGRSVIYQQMRDGVFPRSIKVGPRATSWSEAAVHGWIQQRLAASSRSV